MRRASETPERWMGRTSSLRLYTFTISITSSYTDLLVLSISSHGDSHRSRCRRRGSSLLRTPPGSPHSQPSTNHLTSPTGPRRLSSTPEISRRHQRAGTSILQRRLRAEDEPEGGSFDSRDTVRAYQSIEKALYGSKDSSDEACVAVENEG